MQSILATLDALGIPALDAAAHDLIVSRARFFSLKNGQTVFSAGDSCETYFIVTAGSVRVAVTTAGGREIVLYRVGPGESCVLTTACLMSDSAYDADARAESDVEAIALPRAVLDELLAKSPSFRKFVFSAYGERLHGLIALVQEIAVRQVDRRLARHLASHAATGVIDMTHQALASELGTAREVVTRLLNHFAEKGWLVLERGRIVILQAAALDRYADMN
ncbi:MAG: Crp/Fnr family transcriptional regulator [Beijerinckiaceae bacterium]